MTRESRTVAGILLVTMPTIVYGGVALVTMLVGDPSYRVNGLRQDLWRAGHAHAGVLLLLSLICLPYVDEARLGPGWKHVARLAIPIAAIIMPLAFFLSMASADAARPNALINLAYVGGVLVAAGTLLLGVGLIRSRNS